MQEKIVKGRVGKTPLIRAKNLEKELGISKIFLKLEGNNPSGYLEDRLAYLIIRRALSKGKKTITVGSYGILAASLAYLAANFDIEIIVYTPDSDELKRDDVFDEMDNVKVISFGKTYEECIEESTNQAEKNGWHNANPGPENALLYKYVFNYIMKEIDKQLLRKELDMDSIFSQTSQGFSISGIHSGIRQLWIEEKTDRIPKIFACSVDKGNPIVESFEKGSAEALKIDIKGIRRNKNNRDFITEESLAGQDALNGIYDTNGCALGISKDDLIEEAKLVRKLEKIHISTHDSYPIAGLFKAVKEKKITDGTHVLILRDGMVNLDIVETTLETLPISYERFLELLDKWLLVYTDPINEMKEAVVNAFEEGHVLLAYQQNKLVGITVISRSKFNEFFPKYHLSYIATKTNIKGKGIGTQLMQEAINITEGDISLHVDIENPKAIKLYEKMGFKRKYYRMLYQKD